MTTVEIRASGRIIQLKRADKELFPADGLTKADLAAHYRRVGRRILPQLRGRPLMLERHPDGIDGGRFMQKDTPDHFPDWIHRSELPKEGGTVTHPVCDDLATLLYLAGQACVTPHRWLSKADRPDHPDLLVFDLDPSGEDFEPVREAAGLLHGLLDGLGLPAALMTTGSRGLHVLVRLDRRAPFDEVRAFARDAARLLARRHPDLLSTEARKQARGGRLYLDVQRNAYAQTAVTPYAVRALPGAPVATPLGWDELDDPALTPRRWTLTTLGERLAGEDPWAGELRRGRSLGPAGRRLAAL
ncbi:non-homologous end-joining DNA ligase [Kitasatospora sp. YST-16]|uniref:non-homologous end-joining DNA ligase n=1 Tax=unclassified Kitasatospora TaxID=2633591 RepID=UPI0004C3B073|nr:MULTISPECIES: non-homologous end-joining DNA ligase [unclassified Kitasatospora]WAL74734.1 non-homologous end-joining DNA ligase [Kitasatospora sp. YST-16]WNW40788.1 non-homologous end-joining DNA ligase [Streptomyces sp. Li-HN-5-13]